MVDEKNDFYKLLLIRNVLLKIDLWIFFEFIVKKKKRDEMVILNIKLVLNRRC